MKRAIAVAGALLAAAGIALFLDAFGNHGSAAGGPRVISVLGVAQVQGNDSFVEILAVVPSGRSERDVASEVLREQGARAAGHRDLDAAAFSTSGLVWDQFSDGTAGNDVMTQNYNPAGDATGGAGEATLLASQATWTDVASSKFAFSYGGRTARCPSLVRECPGDQVFDGFNDVGWIALSCNPARCTLGVTWYSTSIDEADMALNSAASWHGGATACTNVNGAYDAQSVFLHENGHALGLGHSSVQQAVMYAYYQGARCALHQDDIDGVSALYPAGGAPAATATPTDTPDPDAPTATATPTPTNTPTPAPNCPPGHQRRGLC